MVCGQRLRSIGIDDLCRDSGDRATDGAGLMAGLFFAVVDYIGNVDRHDRSQLGATITLQKVDAVFFPIAFSDGLAQPLGAGDRIAHRSEFLHRAAAQITGVKVGVEISRVARYFCRSRRWSWHPSD